MMYIVYYTDDYNRRHMAFVKTFNDVKFLMERFYNVTFDSHKVD